MVSNKQTDARTLFVSRQITVVVRRGPERLAWSCRVFAAASLSVSLEDAGTGRGLWQRGGNIIGGNGMVSW